MTDKEKLQCLFEAALKDPSLPSGGMPRRAFPVPVFDAMPVPRVEATPLRALHTAGFIPSVPVAALPAESPWHGSQPTMGRVLDRAASSELEFLMRNQDRRRNRGPRINLAFCATVLAALAAVAAVWWLQSGHQLPTAFEATSELRSASGSESTSADTADENDAVSNDMTALESRLSSKSQR